MTVLEKINKESGNCINLYREGAFWVAYEQSAYLLSQARSLKASKKHVKAAGGVEVVTVGFPSFPSGSVVGSVVWGLPIVEQRDMFVRLQSSHPADNAAFENWKNGISLHKFAPKLKTNSNSAGILSAESERDITMIVEKIRNFDLSRATHNECVVFIAELKNNKINGYIR